MYFLDTSFVHVPNLQIAGAYITCTGTYIHVIRTRWSGMTLFIEHLSWNFIDYRALMVLLITSCIYFTSDSDTWDTVALLGT